MPSFEITLLSGASLLLKGVIVVPTLLQEEEISKLTVAATWAQFASCDISPRVNAVFFCPCRFVTVDVRFPLVLFLDSMNIMVGHEDKLFGSSVHR